MTFEQENFKELCDHLANIDPDLKQIIITHGYPPLWYRKPSFETLIHFILEQQVSLASAMAAMQKLKEKINNITPGNLLALTDVQLRECYFSRQKIVYARCLAEAVQNGTLVIDELASQTNEGVAEQLIKIKGIGKWTAAVFLMMSLRRADIFPLGDVALLNSIRQIKKLSPSADITHIAAVAEAWKPYRTIAAYMLWHSYLERKNRKALFATRTIK